MKNTLKIIAILFLLLNYSCRAQQMIQTPNDAHKLKINNQQFINKPLKVLLKEIKPQIKTAWGNNEGGNQFFSFKFIDQDEIKRKSIKDNSVGLYVYVKENLDWDSNKRVKGKEYLWTKEDIEKYGNLTVIRIKVIGKD
ncbi:hypothetical protein IWX83_000809 [Flavobacterium sp. CG_9.1]|uniref:hypothetical protein n=1 Tax=Flavobacterium sp. CG_9.1 TaxID=2787728 RepID=UPI0018C8EED5|nr:hypothetical protein [Flavobacterium sp. CG_9.1]MBG6061035.1 hypothetical protein [Flavobacterium sp. CG_9.1]